MIRNKVISKNLSKTKFFDRYSRNKFEKILVISIITISFFVVSFFSLIYSGIKFEFEIGRWIQNGSLIRTLSSFFVGFGLAIAGCGMQGVTRNDLSGPTTLGLLPASTLGIIVAEILILDEIYFVYLFAFIFCILVLIINFATLKIKAYKTNNIKSLLIGLIIGVMITSMSIILKSIYPRISESVVIWLGSNSSHNYTWDRLKYSAPAIIIGIILILFFQNKLNIIESDISLATTLGINIKGCYWAIGIGCMLISISSALLFGSVIVLGIVMPHLCRIMLKTRDYKYIMPISGLLSSTTMTLSSFLDIIFPLGISLYSLICFVPFFLIIWLIRKIRRQNAK